MHNKLFIADGAMAVIGGRNIADEYFLRRQSDNFIDLDAFVVGAWWTRWAGCSIATGTADAGLSAAVARRAPRSSRTNCATGSSASPVPRRPATPPALPANDILGYGPIRDELGDRRLGLIWGEARGFADHPDKPFDGSVGGELLGDQRHLQRIRDDPGSADRGADFVAVLRPRRARHATAARTARAWRQGHGADQCARRHGRALGAPGLQPLPRRPAAHGGRPLRTEQLTGQAQQADVPFRREPGPPARQAGGDRSQTVLHRLDELRSAFGDHQHRARRVDRQPGARA